MDSSARYLSQNFVNGMLDTVLVRTNAPKEPCCSICGQDYGEPDEENVDDPALALFNGLPMMTNFTQTTVDPVKTPCGHDFCTPCISLWVAKRPSCPICRAQFDVPKDPNSFRSDGSSNSDSDSDVDFDDGLDYDSQDSSEHSWHVTFPEYSASEIAEMRQEDDRLRYEDFVRWYESRTIRNFLFPMHPIIFAHDPQDVDIILPSIMVIIARRFHLQAQIQGNAARTDMHDELFKFCDGPLTDSPLEDMHVYATTAPVAPLAAHPDAAKLYKTISQCLKRNQAQRPRPSITDDVESQLYDLVKEAMPDGDGGVDPRRWWAYVKCVVKLLVILLARRDMMFVWSGVRKRN